MEKKSVYTDQASEPVGAYRQAVQYKDLLFVSGQIALNPILGSLEIAAI